MGFSNAERDGKTPPKKKFSSKVDGPAKSLVIQMPYKQL